MRNDHYITAEEAVAWLRPSRVLKRLFETLSGMSPHRRAQRFWSSNEWRAVRALIPAPPGDALDIGAGRGVASYALAKRPLAGDRPRAGPQQADLCGGDSDLANEASQSRLWKPRARSCPSRTRVSISSILVLSSMRRICASFAGTGRVLRTGGVYIAAREHVISKKADLDAFLTAHPLHKCMARRTPIYSTNMFARSKEEVFRFPNPEPQRVGYFSV